MQNQNEALMQLAMKTLDCTEKELAARLKVSPKQISQWKQDEDRFPKITDKLQELTGIGDLDPRFVIWTGSVEDVIKWDRLIRYLAGVAYNCSETGYLTYQLKDDIELSSKITFFILHEMGVSFPQLFPTELDIQYETEEDDDILSCVLENPYANLIFNIFCSLNSVYGFYEAYINELVTNEKLDLRDSITAADIWCNLIDLAACKTPVDLEMAPDFHKFQHKVFSDYKEWLTTIRDKAMSYGIPLRANLLALIEASTDELDLAAEAESFGFNEVLSIHPVTK